MRRSIRTHPKPPITTPGHPPPATQPHQYASSAAQHGTAHPPSLPAPCLGLGSQAFRVCRRGVSGSGIATSWLRSSETSHTVKTSFVASRSVRAHHGWNDMMGGRRGSCGAQRGGRIRAPLVFGASRRRRGAAGGAAAPAFIREAARPLAVFSPLFRCGGAFSPRVRPRGDQGVERAAAGRGC